MPTRVEWNISPEKLERAWRTWATAELILCEEPYLRTYAFDVDWADGQRMGKLDDGGGNTVFVFFTPAGTVIKGFDHESEVSRHARDDGEVWPDIYAGMPEPLWKALNDPATEPDDVTFCFWRRSTDSHWWRGFEPPSELEDGSDFLLSRLFGTVDDYAEWAEDNYERSIRAEELARMAGGEPVTPELIVRLNPERNAVVVFEELLESGLIDPVTHSLS